MPTTINITEFGN